MIEQQTFIQNLASELKAVKPWTAWRRSLIWSLGLFVVFAAVMTVVQSFRPHFVEQILTYPRFALELFSGLGLCLFLLYWLAISLIPGAKINKWAGVGGGLSALGFSASLIMSTSLESPPASPLGMRAHCLEEVLIYGALGTLAFIFSARKIDFPLSNFKFFLLGLGSTLFPALLMQVACMYKAEHALFFHYGPALAIALIFGLGHLAVTKFCDI